MARDPYCPGNHPEGWMCVLTRDHDGPHLSLDNRHRWRGTVGKPIRWRSEVKDLPMDEDPEPEPREDPVPGPTTEVTTVNGTEVPHVLPGYTGIPCDSCGSMNTVRSGKCLTCMDCMSAGECG